jgi:alpha-tubulin suppressor-like RCC1 family protein
MSRFRPVVTMLALSAVLSATLLTAVPAGAVTSGQAWAAGNNSEGQLGDGTTTTRSVPGKVLGLARVTAIDAGSTHSMALRADGTVWAWGYNGHHQIGDGTMIMTRTTPVRVPGLSGVKAIFAGSYNGFAVLADGTVRGWGGDGCGELGDGGTTSLGSPVPVFAGLGAIKAIAGGEGHTLVLLANGTVRAVGCNAYGQLGDGTMENVRTTPVPVKGLRGVTAIAAGGVHSLALLGDGTVRAWGNNELGQLGDGTVTNRATPIRVRNLGTVAAIAAGANHSLVARRDGTVRGWGNNGHGQLGEGTTTVVQPTPVKALRLTGIKALAGGWFHSLALT